MAHDERARGWNEELCVAPAAEGFSFAPHARIGESAQSRAVIEGRCTLFLIFFSFFLPGLG